MIGQVEKSLGLNQLKKVTKEGMTKGLLRSHLINILHLEAEE